VFFFFRFGVTRMLPKILIGTREFLANGNYVVWELGTLLLFSNKTATDNFAAGNVKIS
jgi:hypothetical protein